MTLLTAPTLPAAATRPRLDVNDPALAATLELAYLGPLLESLPPAYRTALDVGAHKGDVTELLAGLGFRVVAVEPQANLADRLEARLAAAVANGAVGPDAVAVERCAASDRAGVAELLVGRASTVSTLEPDWTTVAFPEEFRARRTVSVPVRRLADVRADHGIARVGFAKIDVEGHELPALRGLLDDSAAEPPLVVMFEANQRFAAAAEACVEHLRSHGYDRFDVIVREGVAPIAAETFAGPGLPAAWHACDTAGRYFYANVIAYHASLPAHVVRPDLAAFIESYRVAVARDVLRRALRHEAERPVPVQREWTSARDAVRAFLVGEDDWSSFLRHPTCKHMFVRGRWGPAQDVERAALQSTESGRHLLATVADPAAGAPQLTAELPAMSTNTLGMAWYLDQVRQSCGGRLPDRVVEVGGGFGAFARLYATQAPSAAYVIVDLPEMLALQHYYLSHALPGTRVVFAADGAVAAEPGTVTLLPASRIGQVDLTGELFFSTFAYSEMPEALQTAIRLTEWFGASRLFLTGQLAGEAPGATWVDAGQVVAGAMADFRRVQIERFHIGRNYLLTAER